MQNCYHFNLFGVFRGLVNGKPLPRFRSIKVRALLAYLVLEGQQPVLRSHLIDLLWHGYTAESGRASLRVALSDLRRIPDLNEIIEADSESVLLRCNNISLWCDALEAEYQATIASANATQQTSCYGWKRNSHIESIFLAGMEEIDSEPFVRWLEERRRYYCQLQNNFDYSSFVVQQQEAGSKGKRYDVEHASTVCI